MVCPQLYVYPRVNHDFGSLIPYKSHICVYLPVNSPVCSIIHVIPPLIAYLCICLQVYSVVQPPSIPLNPVKSPFCWFKNIFFPWLSGEPSTCATETLGLRGAFLLSSLLSLLSDSWFMGSTSSATLNQHLTGTWNLWPIQIGIYGH